MSVYDLFENKRHAGWWRYIVCDVNDSYVTCLFWHSTLGFIKIGTFNTAYFLEESFYICSVDE